ncbi:MAG: hypothetical protein EOO20_03035 [Chryseobacterium sp.]|nr:MAG: hypothetical protein EOO20_03035 [Chryseobacterium sp.]
MLYIIILSIILLIAVLIGLWNRETVLLAYTDYKKGKSSRIIIWILLFIGLMLSGIPILLTRVSLIPFVYENTGEIGDIIGGTTAPFIGFIGIALTFLAFWVQYQANINQRSDISMERFENQYYEMLRLHKENVQEMDIADTIKGRKCFVRMFYEFRFVYLAMYGQNKSLNLKTRFEKEKLCDLSFRLFFHGIGEPNDDTITQLFSAEEQPLITLVRSYLANVQISFGGKYTANGDKSKVVAIDREDGKTVFEFEMFYYPFDGHSTRLGHYYRHLFQTVSFIVDSENNLTYETKYKYLKLLRAQLSDHEQTLLYYNGLATFGKDWFIREYFSEYRMIKNISFLLADFGIKPMDKLGNKNKRGENIFAWS